MTLKEFLQELSKQTNQFNMENSITDLADFDITIHEEIEERSYFSELTQIEINYEKKTIYLN